MWLGEVTCTVLWDLTNCLLIIIVIVTSEFIQLWLKPTAAIKVNGYKLIFKHNSFHLLPNNNSSSRHYSYSCDL